MPLGKPDPGQVLAHGLSHSFDCVLDDLHLALAPPEQRVEHRPLIAEQAGPEHDHAHDGSHLPGLLRLLRLNQHRGHETLHLGRSQCSLPHLDGNCAQERE